MSELAETMDQAACPVEYTPPGDSIGVKVMTHREGKYLTFMLDNEEYGLEIRRVREIFGYMDITQVPRMPDYVLGVINLRGQVIPVIDLRAKFAMETIETTEQTCIIVVEISHGEQNVSTGIVADQVSEVIDIAEDNIEDPPQFGAYVNTDFMLGLGKIGESVKILLDINKVLNSDEITALAEDNPTTRQDKRA